MISLYDLLEASNGQLFGEPGVQLFTDLCFDAADAQESSLYVALHSEQGEGDQMAEAVAKGATGILCVTPPSFDTDSLSIVLVKDVHAAIMSWARYMLARWETRLVGVAGSSGRALTCEGVRQVLSQQLRVHYRESIYTGWRSVPYTVAKLTADHDVILLDVDATHPGEISTLLDGMMLDVGVVTNVGQAHMDTFESIEVLADEYVTLVEKVKPEGLIVLNYDDEFTRAMTAGAGSKVFTVGAEHFGADLLAVNVVVDLAGTGFDLRHGPNRYVGRWTPLLGKHQLYSVLNALAIGLLFGVLLDDSLRVVKELTPLPGRMNVLRGLNEATLIDDSHSADPMTMQNALEWLNTIKDDQRRVIFIMGNMDNLGAYSQRAHRLIGREAAQVVDLFITEGGEAALAGRAALDEGLDARRLHIAYSPTDAVARLQGDFELTRNDIVLVKGGISAHMERVVQALLADKRDTSQLPRVKPEAAGLVLSSPLRPSWVEIDLGAVAHNVRGIKSMVGPEVALLAVVKADAYGTGAVAVSRTALLNGAEYLATASVGEAMDLRDAGIDAPILILSYTPADAIRQAIWYNLTVTLYDLELARAYDRVARTIGGRLKAHVKVDTGMGRLGVMPSEAISFFRHLMILKNIDIEGIYTHFSAADDDKNFTDQQVADFRQLLKPLRAADFKFKYIHAANSAGTLASKDYHFNMVRCGLALHGLSPSDRVAVPEDFRPALSWKTSIAQVKTLPPGHPVGYGKTYRTRGEERIAVIPVGFADGFRRAPKNWGEVLVHGQRAPLVGRVSMEKSAINVTHIPGVTIGDEVVLLGEQGGERITADDIAQQIGTTNYEVLCTVLPRQARR